MVYPLHWCLLPSISFPSSNFYNCGSSIVQHGFGVCRQFRSTYFAFFMGTFLAASLAARAHHDRHHKWFSDMIELRLLRMLVGAVYTGLSCTQLFYRRFSLFVYSFNAFMIIVLFPYRLTRFPPVEQTSIFAVWCFVISRTSILEGICFCGLYELSVVIG